MQEWAATLHSGVGVGGGGSVSLCTSGQVDAFDT